MIMVAAIEKTEKLTPTVEETASCFSFLELGLVPLLFHRLVLDLVMKELDLVMKELVMRGLAMMELVLVLELILLPWLLSWLQAQRTSTLLLHRPCTSNRPNTSLDMYIQIYQQSPYIISILVGSCDN